MSRPVDAARDLLVDERAGHDAGVGRLAGGHEARQQPAAVGQHHGVADVRREPERDEDDAEREEVGRERPRGSSRQAAAAPPGLGPDVVRTRPPAA